MGHRDDMGGDFGGDVGGGHSLCNGGACLGMGRVWRVVWHGVLWVHGQN